MLSRRDVLRKSGLLAVSARLARAQPPDAARQTNIVILLAAGLPDVALDPSLRLPNLSSFAAESVQFERAYVGCPETGPSQASLITGRFPFACGVLRDGMALPADQPTLASRLKDAGYQTAIVGDWHLGDAEKTDETTRAMDFIKRNKANPFFVLVAWHPADPAALDDNAGAIVGAIDSLQLKNNTIVVFTSSHGYGSGPLEPSVRIPLMLRSPRLKPGVRSGVLASNVDLAPTLLELCGINAGDGMQGRDLMRESPQSIYCAGKMGTPGEWRMLVRGLDKLVVDASQNVTQLYNLGVDPVEMDNLAHDSAFELKRNELKALLSDWMRRTGDGMDPSGLKLRAGLKL
jgi:arylsulfatase A-like enzyme